MQNRKAIILSLGMLLENVDTSRFILPLLKKATVENPQFAFTPDLQRQAFFLSERFNQNMILPQEFEVELLKLLGIKNMQSEEFWDRWGEIITVGALPEKLKTLQSLSHDHNALFYLSSDTNVVHLEKIANEMKAQNIHLDIRKHPTSLKQFPLYASCQIGKNRQELVKHIVQEIESKEFNKPENIVLLLGTPDNIRDKNHQAVAQKEYDGITLWCKENNVSLTLHHNSLDETLTALFASEVIATNVFKLALN